LFYNIKNIKKIEAELETLKKVKNDYIVKYINSWKEKNIYYICMELCKYNLKNIIDLKNICFDMINNNAIMHSIDYFISCEILCELLNGLKYLHSLEPPIIHRDFKPANVLISEKGEKGIFCKICDFGLAKEKGFITQRGVRQMKFI